MQTNYAPQNTQVLGISLVLVRNPKDGKYLAVLQKNSTWWLPGGRVDAPQFWSQGAIRQCKEQAGVDINVKGILRFQSAAYGEFFRFKVVFYGQPKDQNQPAKSKADQQSLGAQYMTVQQILKLQSKWRGPELYQWASYVEKGGKIFPLSILEEIKI